MSSLARLEAAGIKVVAILERHLKSIEIFTDTITWAQLLGFIVNVLKLKELGQQIEAHLTGETSLCTRGSSRVRFLKSYLFSELNYFALETGSDSE